jgi:hypothetical protein
MAVGCDTGEWQERVLECPIAAYRNKQKFPTSHVKHQKGGLGRGVHEEWHWVVPT